MDTMFEIFIVMGIYSGVGAIIYYCVSYFLRALNITRHRTMLSLLAGTVVPLVLAMFLLTARVHDIERAELPSPAPSVARPAPAVASPAPRAPARPVAAESPADDLVTASRLFAGPNQYPPEEFAAYGVLAFPLRVSSQDRSRHLFICEAYITSLPHVSELNVARSEQMVTVWPTDSDSNADDLNRIPQNRVCDVAVDQYGFVTALQALKDAEAAGVRTLGIGPFLLAWSPSISKGKNDALVLVSDLSNVTTFRQAQDILLKWTREIEQNPELWRSGWNIEKLRVEIRLWIDESGPQILALFGAKE